MRRKKLDAIGLEPPEWVNEAGYRYRSRRGFESACAQIREEKRALQLVYAGERLATKEEMERARHAPPRAGVKALAPVQPSRHRDAVVWERLLPSWLSLRPRHSQQ
jgi:hypothetical protein